MLHRPTAGSTTGQPVQPTQRTCSPSGKASPLPAPRTVSVTVLNGAGRDGLAGAVTAQLKARGFHTGAPGNAPATIAGVGKIQYAGPARAGATLLTYYLPGATLAAGGTASGVQVVLGTGFHTLASQASVAKALAKLTGSC
ncbi:MAG TPA: LytR C-terminal domain-containing protein [Jatrophihabitans sp.]|nr:LytR C-terminal domain-containing protein [Jatrophihabitans sp.]